MQEKHVYSVSGITHKIRSNLEVNFPEVWVEGEVSDISRAPSEHIYFILKDEKCQIKAALFRSVAKKLTFALQNGQKVVAYGRISVYESRGEYQLIAQEIELAGRGEFQLAFERLKLKLQKEGLFDEKYKKPIPFLPQRIGVITSPTSAAIQDILNVIERRFATVEILINPVRVQGALAAQEISQAIKEMNEIGDLDVLIVGRGGGSIEDLWAFNEEEVARAIFNSKIPIISAVGHEIDYTIADFVADLRSPTPSAAAELVVKRKEELINRLEQTKTRLKNGIRNRLKLSYSQLEGIRRSTSFTRPLDQIYQYQQHIDDLLGRITTGAKRSLQDYQQNLNAVFSRLKPRDQLLRCQQNLDTTRKLVVLHFKHSLERYQKKLNALLGKLNALNPLAILSRGYSICYKMPEEVIIKDASKVEIKNILQIRLHKGRIICEVEATKK